MLIGSHVIRDQVPSWCSKGWSNEQCYFDDQYWHPYNSWILESQPKSSSAAVGFRCFITVKENVMKSVMLSTKKWIFTIFWLNNCKNSINTLQLKTAWIEVKLWPEIQTTFYLIPAKLRILDLWQSFRACWDHFCRFSHL